MDETTLPVETPAATGASAVSWAAILAGVAAAVGTSLTLFALAAGLGLVRAALALIVTQWISAAVGGYLTGRLRTRWTRTHTHEVFFRDTAHGFITWCVATVLMASGLVTAASGAVAIRSHAGGGIAAYGRSQMPMPTYLPTPSSSERPADGQLVLPDGPGSAAAVQTRRAAIEGREWLHLSAAAPAASAEVADGSSAPLLTALSMLIGAFIASVSAALGGRERDQHP